MRIGIDAHHVNGKPQGSRTHLIELIRALAPLSPHELWIYSFRPEETKAQLEVAGLTHRRLFPASARLRLPLVLPALERLHGLSLFHSQYTAPPLSFIPEVVTIHDILFETHPELFEGAFSHRSVALIRRSARRAKVVLTVSEYSRRAIVERYGVPASRIVVTPNAVDRARFRPAVESEAARDAEARERLGLEGPYVACVGRIEPRKNLPRLVRAFGRARDRLDPRLVLALAGARDFRHEEAFEEAAKLPRGSVRFLGPVPDADLPALYRGAEAFLYPSLVEGFGMPVLEAMACGTPVLSSSRGALAEVGGDAVAWVEPEDEEAIAAGVEAILCDESLRKRLRLSGPARAAAFDWADSARKTLGAYELATRPF